MDALEKGKLYQVKNYRKGWVIAEYNSKLEAHVANGSRSSDGARVWNEKAQHYWRDVVSGNIEFIIDDKDMQVRPVSDEAMQQITALRAEIRRLQDKAQQLRKELRELCN